MTAPAPGASPEEIAIWAMQARQRIDEQTLGEMDCIAWAHLVEGEIAAAISQALTAAPPLPDGLVEGPGLLRSPDKIEPAPDGQIILAWVTPDGARIAAETEASHERVRAALDAGTAEWPETYHAPPVPPEPQWTNDPPTAVGWYWCWEPGITPFTWFVYRDIRGTLRIDDEGSLEVPPKGAGFWLGPIAVPDPPRASAGEREG